MRLLKRLRCRLLPTLLSVLLVGILCTGVAYATDNTTTTHWHAESTDYRLATDLLPDDWEAAINEAALVWTERTDVTITGNTASDHWIWRGDIPPTWQDQCNPTITLACTRVVGIPHMIDADMVFNRSKSMGTSSFNCLFNIGTDVQTVALHEFGHFAGFLFHSNDSGAAMYASYNDCQRTPATHDVNSMNLQYANHP